MTEKEESYRTALEKEIRRWDGFLRALRRDDREAFEEMINASRSYVLQIGSADNSFLFEPFIMSILLVLQKRILALEKTLGIKQLMDGIPKPEAAQEN